MRGLILSLLVLALAVPAAAFEIDGATVTLISPTSVAPGGTYTMLFTVQNASSDAEWIVDIHISFPGGVLDQSSMGHELIATGRPSFAMTVDPTVPKAMWDDNDGGYGEIYSTEACDVWVDWTAPAVFPGTQIFWELWGDVYGAEPHYVNGYIDLAVTAVDQATWSSIKAMYR